MFYPHKKACLQFDISPGGYLTKFYAGRLRPEVQPLTLSYTILAEKVPLLYTFYWKKVSLSHTYFEKSCSSFHVVLNKWPFTTLRGEIIIKGPFKYLNDRFPYPFIYLNLRNPCLFYTWSLKRYPFRAEPPRIGHYREYPPRDIRDLKQRRRRRRRRRRERHLKNEFIFFMRNSRLSRSVRYANGSKKVLKLNMQRDGGERGGQRRDRDGQRRAETGISRCCHGKEKYRPFA